MGFFGLKFSRLCVILSMLDGTITDCKKRNGTLPPYGNGETRICVADNRQVKLEVAIS